jgi:hexokinase
MDQLKLFIENNGISAEHYDMDGLLSGFIREMDAGLSGKPSSLLMLPSYVRIGNTVQAGTKAVAIDAGGTNFRTALVGFDEDGTSHIEGFKKTPMPGSREAITKEEFFRFIADSVSPYLNESRKVSLSFAYPTEILSINDGRIIKLVKEIKVSGIEGCYINRELSAVLKAKGFSDVETYITNDTVATAMAGLAEANSKGYGACVGVIVGTGTNICYPESYGNIKKLGLTGPERMMINVESGNFDKMPRGAIDIGFDSGTVDPGYHQLEKMVSGGYFTALCSYVLKKAVEAELLTPPPSGRCDFDPGDVDGFLKDVPENRISQTFASDEDRRKISILLNTLVDRAAHLIALQIAAASAKAIGRDGSILATVEGTMFYKTPTIREKVLDIFEAWLKPGYGIQVDIKKQEDAVLIGTGAIALTV